MCKKIKYGLFKRYCSKASGCGKRNGGVEAKKSCHHCKHSVINRYTITKKEKSSSGSGGSYSGRVVLVEEGDLEEVVLLQNVNFK